MKLLDTPMTEREKKDEIEMLMGNLARISVSQDILEIAQHLGFAVDRLNMLAQSRILELSRI